MKKQMLALLAIAAMVGCSKSEVVNDETPAGSANTPISFKTFVGKATKATEFKDGEFKTAGNVFKMSAYTSDVFGTEAAKAFITTVGATPVDVTASAGDPDLQWKYDAKYPHYWPAAGEKVSFFGYSDGPMTAATPDVITYEGPADGTTAWPKLTYTVKNTLKAQKDLIVVKAIDQTATTNGGSVALGFTHALTQIAFTGTKATADAGNNIEVSNITLKNVVLKGVYTYAATGSWAPDETSVAPTLTYLDETATPITVTSKTALVGVTGNNTGTAMLIPQTAASVTMSITYKVTNENQELYSGTKTATLTGTWEPGMRITYELTLASGATAIGLQPSVDVWKDPTTPPTPIEPTE